MKLLLILLCLINSCIISASTNLFQKTSPQAQLFFKQGLKQIKNENYQSAIRAFRSAIQYDKNLGEAYLNIGACYDKLGQFEKGIPYFEKAISVDDTNARLIYLFGMALGRNNKRLEAVRYLERAVYISPKNPDYLYNLGVAYSSITQYANAAVCFEEVSNIISNNGAVWFNLGLAKLRLNKTNEAVSAFEKVEIDSPIIARSLYYLAKIAYDKGDYKTALSKIKTSLAIAPNALDALYLKALLLSKIKNYKEGIKILEKIARLSNDFIVDDDLADFYIQWAKIACNRKDYITALHRFKQAEVYLPGNTDLQIDIANCAINASKSKLAKLALARAIKKAETKEQEKKIELLRSKLSNLSIANKSHEY